MFYFAGCSILQDRPPADQLQPAPSRQVRKPAPGDVNKDRLDNGPRGFHRVLTNEEHGHRPCITSGSKFLVSLKLFSLSVVDGGEFDRHRDHTRTGTLDRSTQTQKQFGTESEPKLIAARSRFANSDRKALVPRSSVRSPV